MKVNIVGSGSIGSSFMSASLIIDDHILVDAPNGIIKYLKHLDYDILKIDTIIITHLHGDHFFDLPFLMLGKYFNHDKTLIKVICPYGTTKKIQKLFRLGFPYDFRKVMENINIEFIEHKGRNNIILDDNIKIKSINVKHGTMKPCFGYIININGKTVGFSGDSSYCNAIDKIVEASDVSILDMSLKENGDKSHMGFLDIKEICKKYPNKKIVATHMRNSTREVALDNPIKNLIIPIENFEIKL